ncbi:MAG: response regulator transcription factor [Clostridia bacterium]|nr:response regulator transcription factor [Clostridia bacterium]
MRVAVTDDDPVVAEKIGRLVRSEDPDARIDLYHSGEEMLLSGRDFDLVYLDVRMDGADGIETARRLQQHQKDVLLIFVSGLRESVFEALDVHPFHFLLKPIDEQQFARVFREASDAAAVRREESGGHLHIRNRKENVLLPVRDILYIESRSRKLEIHTEDCVYEMYGALRQMETELGSRFYRTHRAFLVNMDWIRSYQPDSVTLRNGAKAFLTRKKYGAFVKAYMWYLQTRHGIV